MLYAPLSDDLKREIIACCEKDDINRPDFNFRSCIVLGQYLIKYSSHRSLWPQYQTQEYIFEMTVGDPTAPRVPKIYEYFTPGGRMAYLVMEYIDAESASAWSTPRQVTEALQWLRDLPAPRDAVVGTVGGGYARHRIFKDDSAPMPFSSMGALQRYMNTALEWIPHSGKISFRGERLVFTQSNMDESNFFLNANGKMCTVDFEYVALLPESFASYIVHSASDHFIREVAGYLDWPPSPNLHLMAVACEILNMIGDRTLGLNENGRRKA